MQRKGFVAGEPFAVLVQFASAAGTSARFNEGLENKCHPRASCKDTLFLYYDLCKYLTRQITKGQMHDMSLNNPTISA